MSVGFHALLAPWHLDSPSLPTGSCFRSRTMQARGGPSRCRGFIPGSHPADPTHPLRACRSEGSLSLTFIVNIVGLWFCYLVALLLNVEI